MKHENELSRPRICDFDLRSVPDEFPRTERHGAVSGAGPKLLMSEYNGKLYKLGCSPPEVFERWQICEHLATQLAARSISSKRGKRSHMSEVEILGQYLPRLVAQDWTSEAEARWVIRRAAQILGWPAPPSSLASN